MGRENKKTKETYEKNRGKKWTKGRKEQRRKCGEERKKTQNTGHKGVYNEGKTESIEQKL